MNQPNSVRAPFWQKYFPLFLFLFALGLRLAYDYFLRHSYFFYDSPSSDVSYYQDWARDIARGNWLGRESFLGLPLYPYFLAVLLRLTLENMDVVRGLHLALGALNCVLVFVIGRKVFSPRVGMLAGVLLATNYTAIYYDWLMMPVPLLVSLTLLVILSLLYSEILRKKTDWLFLGLFLGMLILGDGKFLFFLVYLALSKCWAYRKNIGSLQNNLLPLVAGVIVVLLCSGVRYRLVTGDWVFLSPQGGLSLYTGNNPQATGVYDHPLFLRPDHAGQDLDQKIVAEKVARREMSPRQLSQFWRSQALYFIRNHPGQALDLFGKKLALFFTDTEWAHDLDLLFQREWKAKADFNPFFVMCPLALLGIVISWRSFPQSRMLVVVLGCQLLTTLVFFLTTRHRVSVLPIFLIFEAGALVWLGTKIRLRQKGAVIVAVLGVAGFVQFFPPVSADKEFLTYLTNSKAAPIYEKKQDFARAYAAYQTALRIRPGDSMNIFNLGNLYQKTGDLPGAKQQYLAALAICPYNVDAIFNLAFVSQQLGETGAALKLYQEVLNYAPQSSDAHYRLAEIYQSQGDCQQANQHFAAIVQIQPILRDVIAKYQVGCQAGTANSTKAASNPYP